MKYLGPFIVIAASIGSVRADDLVAYRERTGRGEHLLQTIRGRIESDSLVGIRIGGKTLPATEIVDVQYEVPGQIKLDLPRAAQAEAAPGRAEEAVREFRALLAAPIVAAQPALKRSFEYRIARLIGIGDDADSAVAALEAFILAYPDCWQRVPATHLLARRYLDRTPSDFVAARKAYSGLAAAGPSDVKADCDFAVIDLLLEEKNITEARRRLSTVAAANPRRAAYAILLEGESAEPAELTTRLQALIEKCNDEAKPALYNLLGDIRHSDPTLRPDAVFAYLYVDQVYNFDPYELMKARGRLAQVFAERGQDARAKQYREKALGR